MKVIALKNHFKSKVQTIQTHKQHKVFMLVSHKFTVNSLTIYLNRRRNVKLTSCSLFLLLKQFQFYHFMYIYRSFLAIKVLEITSYCIFHVYLSKFSEFLLYSVVDVNCFSCTFFRLVLFVYFLTQHYYGPYMLNVH